MGGQEEDITLNIIYTHMVGICGLCINRQVVIIYLSIRQCVCALAEISGPYTEDEMQGHLLFMIHGAAIYGSSIILQITTSILHLTATKM